MKLADGLGTLLSPELWHACSVVVVAAAAAAAAGVVVAFAANAAAVVGVVVVVFVSTSFGIYCVQMTH